MALLGSPLSPTGVSSDSVLSGAVSASQTNVHTHTQALATATTTATATDADVGVDGKSSYQYSLVSPAVTVADSIAFNEDIGLGAISKAGGLPTGSNGEWVQFAEEKLQKDNDLDYQQLLWELGTSIIEKKHIEQGTGVNSTKEDELLVNMKRWFVAGGGKFKFVEPSMSGSTNKLYELRAVETVDLEESVLTVPMKLIMCQQTARNVLIHNKGKYLGEELTKTFEKDEVWGLSIFLLHEYYKQKSGVGSKWGPFIQTLRMRTLSAEALAELQGTLALELVNKWTQSTEDLSW